MAQTRKGYQKRQMSNRSFGAKKFLIGIILEWRAKDIDPALSALPNQLAGFGPQFLKC